MTSTRNDVNMAYVVVPRVRSEIVNSIHEALRMVYPYSPAKHTIDGHCVSSIQVVTTLSLSLFTFEKRSLDLHTEIPSIEQLCHGTFVDIPYTWISATQNAEVIFVIRHDNTKYETTLR